jgi:hypothetical protein
MGTNKIYTNILLLFIIIFLFSCKKETKYSGDFVNGNTEIKTICEKFELIDDFIENVLNEIKYDPLDYKNYEKQVFTDDQGFDYMIIKNNSIMLQYIKENNIFKIRRITFFEQLPEFNISKFIQSPINEVKKILGSPWWVNYIGNHYISSNNKWIIVFVIDYEDNIKEITIFQSWYID